jgi:hypothetical protein
MASKSRRRRDVALNSHLQPRVINVALYDWCKTVEFSMARMESMICASLQTTRAVAT